MIVKDKKNEVLYIDNIAVVSPLPALREYNFAFKTAYEVIESALNEALEQSLYKKDSVVPVIWGCVNGEWVGAVGMLRVIGDSIRFSFFGYDGDYEFRLEEDERNRRLGGGRIGGGSHWEKSRVRFYGENPDLFQNRHSYVTFSGLEKKDVSEVIKIMVNRIFR